MMLSCVRGGAGIGSTIVGSTAGCEPRARTGVDGREPRAVTGVDGSARSNSVDGCEPRATIGGGRGRPGDAAIDCVIGGGANASAVAVTDGAAPNCCGGGGVIGSPATCDCVV